MITILPHLGLGDQLVLNGLVRHFAESEKVITFAKRCHYPSVSFMYRDIPDRVQVIPLDKFTTDEMMEHVKGRVLPLGVHGIPPPVFSKLVVGEYSQYINWVCMLYIQSGLHPNTMYRKFKVVRDTEKEFTPPTVPYVFVHDDKQRGREIKVDTEKLICRPQSSTLLPDGSYQFDDFNIFDYLSVIENASERHMMNSSFNWLVEIMGIGDKTTNFFHLNVGAHDYFPPENTKTLCTDDLWTLVENV